MNNTQKILLTSGLMISSLGVFCLAESTFNDLPEPVISENNQVDLCSLNEVVCEDEDIIKIIENAANKYGVSFDLMLNLAHCESTLNHKASHLNYNGSIDRGLYQWNSKAHPEVSDDCAYSAKCAADITAKHISQYGSSIWTCSAISN